MSRRGCYGKIGAFPLSDPGTPPSRPNSHAISNLERIPESLIEVLSLDAEAEALAAEYIRDGAVGKNNGPMPSIEPLRRWLGLTCS